MKTIKFTFIILLTTLTSFAQVGIGNTDPKATLDITASNVATPSNTDGILIPRIDALPTTNPTTDQNGMLVYLTTVYGSLNPGFYYWDNTTWKNITKTYTVSNGLTETFDNIRLGGDLIQNTTIDIGTYSLSYNLGGGYYSYFNVKDNGSTVFSIGNGTSNGRTTFGQDTYWKDNSTSGTTLGRFYGTSSGIFELYNSGSVSTRLGATGTSFFANSNLGIGTTSGTTYRLNVHTTSTNYVANFQQLSNTGNTYAKGVSIRLADSSPNTNYRYLSLFRNSTIEAGKISGSSSGTGVLYATTSDRRLKTDIEYISNALELLDQIQPRLYEFKEAPGVKEYGFIAQDLQKVYPQAVAGSPDSDPTKNPMMVDYGRLTPILTASVKELYQEVIKLKNENELLLEKLNQLQQLEARLTALEQPNSTPNSTHN